MLLVYIYTHASRIRVIIKKIFFEEFLDPQEFFLPEELILPGEFLLRMQYIHANAHMFLAYAYTHTSRMRVTIEGIFLFKKSFPPQEFFLPEELIFPGELLLRMQYMYTNAHMSLTYAYTYASRMRVIVEGIFLFEEFFPLQEFFLSEGLILPGEFLLRICL
jgi:hypothetical protein